MQLVIRHLRKRQDLIVLYISSTPCLWYDRTSEQADFEREVQSPGKDNRQVFCTRALKLKLAPGQGIGINLVFQYPYLVDRYVFTCLAGPILVWVSLNIYESRLEYVVHRSCFLLLTQFCCQNPFWQHQIGLSSKNISKFTFCP